MSSITVGFAVLGVLFIIFVLYIIISLCTKNFQDNNGIIDIYNDDMDKFVTITQDKEQDILEAIRKLDKNNPKHWAYFGQSRQRPSLKAIENILGYRPSFSDLLVVWNRHLDEE